MRRLSTLATGVLTAVTLVAAPVLVGTSAATPSAPVASAHHGVPSKAPARRAPADQAHAHEAKVVLVGVVSATPTVQSAPSGTSTVVLSLRVQGGDKEYRGRTVQVTVPSTAVVERRGVRDAPKQGDRVAVLARREATGVLTATRVVSGRPVVVPRPPAATRAVG